MHWIYLIHEFHNLSWITEINEIVHDILIYWDALVCIYIYIYIYIYIHTQTQFYLEIKWQKGSKGVLYFAFYLVFYLCGLVLIDLVLKQIIVEWTSHIKPKRKYHQSILRHQFRTHYRIITENLKTYPSLIAVSKIKDGIVQNIT